MLLALVLLAALLVVWVVFLTLAGTVKSHGPKHRAAKIVVAQR